MYARICMYMYVTSSSSKDTLLDREDREARALGYPNVSSIVAAAVAGSTPVRVYRKHYSHRKLLFVSHDTAHCGIYAFICMLIYFICMLIYFICMLIYFICMLIYIGLFTDTFIIFMAI